MVTLPTSAISTGDSHGLDNSNDREDGDVTMTYEKKELASPTSTGAKADGPSAKGSLKKLLSGGIH